MLREFGRFFHDRPPARRSTPATRSTQRIAQNQCCGEKLQHVAASALVVAVVVHVTPRRYAPLASRSRGDLLMEKDDRDFDHRRRRFTYFTVLAAIVAFAALDAGIIRKDPSPYFPNDRHGGRDWKLLLSGNAHDDRFYNFLHMNHDTFVALADFLRPYRERDERETSWEQRVAIAVNYFAHPDSQRGESENNHLSGSTISEILHEVVNAITLAIAEHGLGTPSSPQATATSQYYHFFNGCVGIIDGTFIPIICPTGGEGGWRNRKGFLAQNVFVACNLDLRVVYCLTGMEGIVC